jgi:hypothetical protein
VSIIAKLGGLFGGRGAGTEFDKLGRDLRSLGVKTKVVDEFERVCGKHPESAALGLDTLRNTVASAKSLPKLDPMAVVMLQGVVLAAATTTVQHATGEMPSLSHLLD